MQLAKRFGQDECKETKQPLPAGIGELYKVVSDENCKRPIRNLIGGLLYIANVCRPVILASVSILSRFMEKPSELLWKLTCQVLRYLVSTCDWKLKLGVKSDQMLQVFANSDYGSDEIS